MHKFVSLASTPFSKFHYKIQNMNRKGQLSSLTAAPFAKRSNDLLGNDYAIKRQQIVKVCASVLCTALLECYC